MPTHIAVPVDLDVAGSTLCDPGEIDLAIEPIDGPEGAWTLAEDPPEECPDCGYIFMNTEFKTMMTQAESKVDLFYLEAD